LRNIMISRVDEWAVRVGATAGDQAGWVPGNAGF
jgi:hypothetical protein